MTWVIGGRHLFCARCLADVQVTLNFQDRPPVYIDCIQKVHRIGPDLVVAFADSVRLGFFIVNKLRTDFYPKLDRRLCTNSWEILKQLDKFIRYITGIYYKKSAADISGYVPERVELMILFQPKLTQDMFSIIPENFPHTEVWKMEIPSFRIWEPAEAFQLLELGSGSTIEDYRDIVERHQKGFYEVASENGGLPDAIIPSGKVALEWLFSEAKQFQHAGISKAMHVTLLTPKGVFMRPISESLNKPFPNVVDNWPDFKKLVATRNIKMADFTATA